MDTRSSIIAKSVVKEYCDKTGLLSLDGSAAKVLEDLILSALADNSKDGDIPLEKVGEFEGKATVIEVDGQPLTALWTDGVMLSADNGKSKMMPGVAPSSFTLESGVHYKVTVSKI